MVASTHVEDSASLFCETKQKTVPSGSSATATKSGFSPGTSSGVSMSTLTFSVTPLGTA